jgi:hypothetical protein
MYAKSARRSGARFLQSPDWNIGAPLSSNNSRQVRWERRSRTNKTMGNPIVAGDIACSGLPFSSSFLWRGISNDVHSDCGIVVIVVDVMAVAGKSLHPLRYQKIDTRKKSTRWMHVFVQVASLAHVLFFQPACAWLRVRTHRHPLRMDLCQRDER